MSARHPEEAPPPLPNSPADLEHSLLGGERRWRRRDVARGAGVSVLSARKLWRALGFPSVDEDTVAFTDDDADALNRTVTMVREELLDEETTIAFARALGQTTDRLVSWQIEALMEHLVRCPHPNCADGSATGAVAHLAGIVDDLEALLVYAWRRKLAAAVSRLEHPGPGEEARSAKLTVGFADLVSYTRLAQRLSQRELSVLVQRFEGLTADVITAGGGRVVKPVGDEVLFTADDPLAAAVIGLSVSERMASDEVVPNVRVGIAHGLGNARKLLDEVREGRSQYHAIEIMACPGGCIGGGGQPKTQGRKIALEKRAEGLNKIDSSLRNRVSKQNQSVQAIYDKYLEYPMSRKAKELVHTKYFPKFRK